MNALSIRNDDDLPVASQWGRRKSMELSLSSRQADRVDLVVRELCWNLIRHAGGGELALQALHSSDGVQGLRIEARDQGPGIHSLQASREGLGAGIGSLLRQGDELTLSSGPASGTHVRVVLWWPVHPPAA